MSSSSSLKQDDTPSSPELPPLAAPGIAAAAAAAAAAASSGGGGLAIGSGRRLPPPCWTHEETLALIEAYRDKWEALKKGNLRAADWDEVAGAVTARCGRFPTATYKSGVQCRHKIEKLRKRYRAERSRSAGRSKGPKWPFFALLHDLAGGTGATDSSANPIIKIRPRNNHTTHTSSPNTNTPASPSSLLSSPTSSDEAGRSRSLHGLISNGGGGSGLRFTIPKGSRTRPGAPPPRDLPTKPEDQDPEAEAMAEVASALRAVGEGFLRMEERRLELSLQMEKERMEAEMKRTQTMLDAQQLFVEAFLGKHHHPHHQHHKRAKLVSSSSAAAMDED